MISFVQYYPFTNQVGRIHVLQYYSERVRYEFLDEVNLSDYEHNSIVFVIDGDAKKMDIKEEFEKYFKVTK